MLEVPPRVLELERVLKWYAHLYFRIRKNFDGTVMMVKSLVGRFGTPPPEVGEYLDMCGENYGIIRELLGSAASEHPVFVNHLSRIKGVTPFLAGLLLGIMPARRFPTVSALWKYCRLDPGARKRVARSRSLRKENKAGHVAHLIAVALVYAKSRYAEFYERFFEEEMERTANFEKAKARAYRRLKKLFLAHYFVKYYEEFGGRPPLPYIVERGRRRYIPPIVD